MEPTLFRAGLVNEIAEGRNPAAALLFLATEDAEAAKAATELQTRFPAYPSPGQPLVACVGSSMNTLLAGLGVLLELHGELELNAPESPDRLRDLVDSSTDELAATGLAMTNSENVFEDLWWAAHVVRSAHEDLTKPFTRAQMYHSDDTDDVEAGAADEASANEDHPAQPDVVESVEEVAADGWAADPDTVMAEAARRLDELDWEHHLDIADRIRDAVEEHVAPDAHQLGELVSLSATLHDIAERVAAAANSVNLTMQVEPGDSAIRTAIETLRTRVGASDVFNDLVTTSGPAHFESAIAVVREAAAAALTGDADPDVVAGLTALHQLAVACAARKADPAAVPDFAKLGEWDAQARAHLPQAAQLAVSAAMLGDLSFTPAATPATDSDTPTVTVSALVDANPEEPEEASTERTAFDQPEEPVAQDADPEPAATDEPVISPDAAHDDLTEPDDTEAPNAGDSPPTDADPVEPDAPADVVEVVEVAADEVAAPEVSEPPATVEEPSDDDLLAELRASLTLTPARGLTKPERRTPDPAPVTQDSPADPAPDATVDEHAEMRATEAALLSQGRYGLAALLHDEPAHQAARRLAAYQQHITAPAGAQASAFATAAVEVSRDALADDRPGQLLAWASAVRVSLIAPAAGAPALLTELGPCVANWPALTAVGDAFTQAALAGAIVLADAAQDLSAFDQVETGARDTADRAAAILEGAPRRSIKYTPANGVYQNWMDPKAGLLGQVLAQVAENDHENAPAVLAAVTGLRGNHERNLDDTFSGMRRRSRKEKIVGGARSTLVSAYIEALDLATEWAENATATRERRSKQVGDSRFSRPLDALRQDLQEIRTQALAELDTMREQVDSDDPAAAAFAAAAQAAAQILSVAFTISDGHPPTGSEPTPTWSVAGELLDTDLSLDLNLLPTDPQPATGATGEATTAADEVEDGATVVLAPETLPVLQQAIFDLAQRPWDPQAAFDRRTARGEHDLTGTLISNLPSSQPDLVRDLRAERDAAIAAQRADLDIELNSADALIRFSLRDATLPDEVATGLAARIDAARDPRRVDLRQVRATIAYVTTEIGRHRAAQISAAQERITSASTTSPPVAEHAELLLGLVTSGEVAGALEYLEQLLATGRLPEKRDDGAHFAKFFPRVPDLAATNEHLLESLRRTLDPDASDPTDVVAGNGTAIDDLAAITGTDLALLSETSRTRALHALSAWNQLMHGRVTVDDALRRILGLAGYEFTSASVGNRPQGRTWVQLSGVSAVGHAMSPALGSAMSRGGTSLRVLVVKSPTTPATLIDWMRHERPEDTVLVLHVATYSAEERRALANASRGRPQPVVAVLDPAAIAYLAVQPEHRRSTFAELVLPFTGDSPYRDRAGRAAPEMFYGRTAERHEVMNLEGPSFVSGGRQLGKSALLWSARDEFDDARHRRAVLLEIRPVGSEGDPEQLWPRLMSALVDADVVAPPEGAASPAGVDAQAVEDAIKAWIEQDPDQRRLLVLLDEADLFLDADAAGSRFMNISRCKHIMDSTDRRVKFVFAGLHRTARFESLPNQPLAHLGRPVIVGPLRPQAAYDLVTRPLAVLGYQFADPQLQPARILAFTNNVPSLLQLFGRALITHLGGGELREGPPVIITDDDITAVLEDANLLDAFRDKYLLTLRLDQRYTAIVYAVAYAALQGDLDLGLTLSELDEVCHMYWPEGFGDVTLEHLRGLVTECCDLGVLAHDAGRYRMRTQTLLRLLGTLDQVEETLLTASEQFVLPSAADVESHRQVLAGSSHRFPLTSRQTAQVLSGTSPVVILAGNNALGVQWVASAFEQLGRDGASRARRVVRVPDAAGVTRHLGAASGSVLLVVDARGARPADLATIVEAAETHPRLSTTTPTSPTGQAGRSSSAGEVVVAVAADASSASYWSRRADLVTELRAVNPTGVRSWCEEAGAPFHNAEDQAKLLAVSGAWLTVLDSTLGPQTSADPAATLDVAAAAFTVTENAEKFLGEVSLAGPRVQLSGRDVTAATRQAVLMRDTYIAVEGLTGSDPQNAEPLDELALVLTDHPVPTDPASGGGAPTLGASAAAAGFENLDAVLVTLRAFGALRGNAEGRLYAEPTVRVALDTIMGGVR